MSAETEPCALPGCERLILPREVFCYPHWAALSPAHRRRIAMYKHRRDTVRFQTVLAAAVESLAVRR